MKKKFVAQQCDVSLDAVATEEASIATLSFDFTMPNGEVQRIEVHGTARKDPIDRFDEEIAIKLAMSRALDRAARKLAKQANGKVKANDDNRERVNSPLPATVTTPNLPANENVFSTNEKATSRRMFRKNK